MLAIAALLLVLVVATGADLRRFANALGVAVFGLLIWRVASTWDLLSPAERTLALLLATGPLAAAAAGLVLVARATELPPNPAIWAVIAHRVLCLAAVVFWPHWIHGRARIASRPP
jgi:hypothetical protein